jgi:serine/threonine-protein kinase RsbW
MPQTRVITLKNNVAELERVNQEVTEFLEANQQPPKTIYVIVLALEEMITNIIKYGYDDPSEHTIDVNLQFNESHITVTLTDDGHEFNPLAQPEVDVSQPLEERGIGGLGIHLVRRTMDALDYQRRNGRNIFTMHKKTA